MSTQIVTCPGCQQVLRSEQPIPSGSRLRCPGCRASFLAPEVELFTPPSPPPSLFGAPFVIAVTVALLLGGAIITAALLVASRPQAPTAQAEEKPDDADRRRLEDELRKLDEKSKDLDRKQQKLELARLLSRGESLASQGKFAEAAAVYKQALELDEKSAEALEGLVSARASEVAAKKGKENENKRQAEIDRLLAEGKKALTDKQFALAVRTLESARQLSPTNKAVLEALAEAQNALEADQTEKQKLAEYRKHMDAGKAALAGERFGDAVREYAAAVRLMPDDLEAQQGRKQAEAKLAAVGDKEKRQAAFDNLLDRARKAHADRRFNDAIQALGPALKLMPDDREAQRLMRAAQTEQKAVKAKNANLLAQANEAIRLGRLEEAQRLAEEAVKNWPEDDQAEKAARNARRLLENAQTTQAAYLRYMQSGALAMSGGRYAEAVTAYTEALRLVPNDLEVQQNLRVARVALEKELRVRLEYDRLIKAGTAALQRRSFDEATKLFRDARRLMPGDLVARNGLSQARYGKAVLEGQQALQQRRKADAIRAFEVALREKPGDLMAQNGLRQAQFMR